MHILVAEPYTFICLLDEGRHRGTILQGFGRTCTNCENSSVNGIWRSVPP